MDLPGGNPFKKLLSSLLLDSSIERKRKPKAIDEAGFHTPMSAFKERRWLYCTDLDRIVSEVDMVISLFSSPPDEDYYIAINTTKSKYFVFLVGSFLNLIHQAKDKLFRLLYSLDCNSYEEYSIRAEKIKTPKLSKVKKLGIVKLTNIETELNEWDETSISGIGITLKRRTLHHHDVSRIPLNEDLQRVDLEWIMRGDSFLTEYGKTKIKEESQAAFKRWHKENLDIIMGSNINILNNLNSISNKILLSDIDIPKSMDVFYRAFPESLSPEGKRYLESMKHKGQ